MVSFRFKFLAFFLIGVLSSIISVISAEYDNRKSLPSRPPSPLLISRGADFINLKLSEEDESMDVTHYLLQIESKLPDDDFKGYWDDVTSNHTSSRNTLTLKGLSSTVDYRFRSKAVNHFGESPWSEPSISMRVYTFVSVSSVNLTVGKITPTSVELNWNTNIQGDLDPSTQVYRIQYRQHDQDLDRNLSETQNVWIDYPVQISAVKSKMKPEIQEVTSHVDYNSSITNGKIWLKLDLPFNERSLVGQLPSDKILSSTISKSISYNATEQEFEEAICKVQGILHCKVHRYEPDKFHKGTKSSRGSYSWRIEFTTDAGPIPLFTVYKSTLNGGFTGKKQVTVKRILHGRHRELLSDNKITITGLEGNEFYDFRVRGESECCVSDWITLPFPVKTPIQFPSLNKPIPNQSKYTKEMAGIGRNAGNIMDPDYINGAGMGGVGAFNGGDGLVVFILYDSSVPIRSKKTSFYFSGFPQIFTIPESYSCKYIDIKVWGGGGSGGGSNPNKLAINTGGGGGFLQSRFRTNNGDSFVVIVGGGGKYNRLDQDNGRNGFTGGVGGKSVNGLDAGQGGGHSAVYRSTGELLIASGGGGGGGSSNDCCSHGGPGGGLKGENGGSPSAPLLSTKDTEDIDIDKQTFISPECKDDFCVDMSHHLNDDEGFDPKTSYNIISTEGGKGGATLSWGGTQIYTNPYSLHYQEFNNNNWISPTPGGYGYGGKASDGKEGGGGGGSGFHGGFGGFNGTGGGGGAGYIDFNSVYNDIDEASIRQRPPSPNLINATDDSISISWSLHSNVQVHYFTIEIAEHCSEDFKVIELLNADNKFEFEITLAQLSPDTIYCLRYVQFSDTKREQSLKLRVCTLETPKNIWKSIFPIEVATQEQEVPFNSSHNYCRLPKRPSPRSGHSLSIVLDSVILFGGLARICTCDQKGRLKACQEEDTFTNEVWMLQNQLWTLLRPHSIKDSVPKPRAYHSATVLENGKILIIGGKYRMLDEIIILNDVWEFDAIDPFQSEDQNNAMISSAEDSIWTNIFPSEDTWTSHQYLNLSEFSPRYQHTAIAVKDDVFIFGGYCMQRLQDTWRFNYHTRTFTELNGAKSLRQRWNGQSAVLTPFGVLAYGGIKLAKHGFPTLEKDIFVLSLINNGTRTKIRKDHISTNDEYYPEDRYLSSLAYLYTSFDCANPTTKKHGITLFGGERHFPRRMDDMWVLSLDHMAKSEPTLESKAADCSIILSIDERKNPWYWTCGKYGDVNSNTECELEDVLRMAWCKEQYNSFNAPW